MRQKLIILLGIMLLLPAASVWSGNQQPRMRVIIDNDFGGDPDGLFQLAQHLLSSSSEIKGIICSHHYNDFGSKPGHVRHAAEEVDGLLEVMQCHDVPVYLGSDSSFTATDKPLESEGARAIVNEAMRDDETPLYIVCGAGLTNIASAYLMEPQIAKRITAVVWIGGPEYASLCRNQLQKQREYNQGIDPVSTQIVYNRSDLHLWQVPRDVYRQVLYSFPEMDRRIAPTGKTGAYLMSKLHKLKDGMNGRLGETYILGDSPLVLLTSLQTPWEQDPASCEYVICKTPKIKDDGFYEENPDGRPIRIFTRVDARLILEDLVAKLEAMK